jgi:hypothetical protein
MLIAPSAASGSREGEGNEARDADRDGTAAMADTVVSVVSRRARFEQCRLWDKEEEEQEGEALPRLCGVPPSSRDGLTISRARTVVARGGVRATRELRTVVRMDQKCAGRKVCCGWVCMGVYVYVYVYVYMCVCVCVWEGLGVEDRQTDN